MTPDELVVLMLERLARAGVQFRVENYAATRSAAERLLRTVGAVPSEPPREIEAPPTVDSQTQLLPVYDPGRVYEGHRRVYGEVVR